MKLKNCEFIFASVVVILSQVDAKGCQFVTDKRENEMLMKEIQPLLGKRYKAVDAANEYMYYIGICTEGPVTAEEGDISGVGVLQRKISDKMVVIIGKYTASKLMNGTDWIMLEYEKGDSYHSHCGSEPRRARIIISCDDSVKLGEEIVRVFEEQNAKTEDCYYLFEMSSSVTCKKTAISNS